MIEAASMTKYETLPLGAHSPIIVRWRARTSTKSIYSALHASEDCDFGRFEAGEREPGPVVVGQVPLEPLSRVPMQVKLVPLKLCT